MFQHLAEIRWSARASEAPAGATCRAPAGGSPREAAPLDGAPAWPRRQRLLQALQVPEQAAEIALVNPDTSFCLQAAPRARVATAAPAG